MNSQLPETVTLTAEDEARRLWKGACEALGRAGESLVSLTEALDLGIRAAEILVVQQLLQIRVRFPATIQDQLETPTPTVQTHRDAIDTPKALGFREILDLLSQPTLECVAPGLHRGWEDRRFSCLRSRETAGQVLPIELSEGAREDLLLLLAYRNRIFRYPPPVEIHPLVVIEAFSALQQLMDRLSSAKDIESNA